MPDKEFVLKPCPFCGDNEAPLVVVRRGKDGWRDRFLVLCDYEHGGCGGSSGWYHYEPEAVGAWNRRATAADAEPKQRWIPVTERPPEEPGEYIVAYHPCHWDFVEPSVKVGIDTFRGKTAWAKRKYQRVIAWQEKPEPPKGEKEN